MTSTQKDRIRFETIISLMGVKDRDVHMDLFDTASATYPDGGLTLTHGPYDDVEGDPATTFENLVTMSWQDAEYGVHYDIRLWVRDGE